METIQTSFPIITAFVLGLLTILDPCTLFTSVTAIGYIDQEIKNRRLILVNGSMFVLGKLMTYIGISMPFILGAKTNNIQHFMCQFGEPILAIFLIICGIFMLIGGGHHHKHDHGMSRWLKDVDNQSSWLWSFMLGIFFSIAFCPHRLIYFFTMIDITIATPATWSWILPLVFGLGTSLPILVIAWLLSYGITNLSHLTQDMKRFDIWFRRICGAVFLAFGIYIVIHSFIHEGHECAWFPIQTILYRT